VPEHPAAFVIVGMTACFGSAARAPLAVMVMVAEMTGGFSMLPGRISRSRSPTSWCGTGTAPRRNGSQQIIR